MDLSQGLVAISRRKLTIHESSTGVMIVVVVVVEEYAMMRNQARDVSRPQ